MKFHHISLRVKDFSPSLRFYTELVGLTVMKQFDANGGNVAYLADAEGETEVELIAMPEGQTFEGAGMPYWHRFTPDGVGLHTGKVIVGRRLSHGCVRTQNHVARKFFQHSVLQLPVYITRAVEDYYRGGFVKPIDVKYRPKPGNDYTDNVVPTDVRVQQRFLRLHQQPAGGPRQRYPVHGAAL